MLQLILTHAVASTYTYGVCQNSIMVLGSTGSCGDYEHLNQTQCAAAVETMTEVGQYGTYYNVPFSSTDMDPINNYLYPYGCHFKSISGEGAGGPVTPKFQWNANQGWDTTKSATYYTMICRCVMPPTTAPTTSLPTAEPTRAPAVPSWDYRDNEYHSWFEKVQGDCINDLTYDQCLSALRSADNVNFVDVNFNAEGQLELTVNNVIKGCWLGYQDPENPYPVWGNADSDDWGPHATRLCIYTAPPTSAPSATPTTSPTASPTSSNPTISPTTSPTMSPTMSPTAPPTSAPSATPTTSPTTSPTITPTKAPAVHTWDYYIEVGHGWFEKVHGKCDNDLTYDQCLSASRSVTNVDFDENVERNSEGQLMLRTDNTYKGCILTFGTQPLNPAWGNAADDGYVAARRLCLCSGSCTASPTFAPTLSAPTESPTSPPTANVPPTSAPTVPTWDYSSEECHGWFEKVQGDCDNDLTFEECEAALKSVTNVEYHANAELNNGKVVLYRVGSIKGCYLGQGNSDIQPGWGDSPTDSFGTLANRLCRCETSSTSDSTTSDSTTSDTGAIVGASVGGVVVLGGIGYVIYLRTATQLIATDMTSLL